MKTFVSGAVEAADHHHVVEMKSLAPASTCFASTKGLYGMQIVHRYGPCTPLGQENPSPDSHHILIKDQARVRSINSKTSNKYATYDHDGLRTRLTVKAETFQPHTMTLFGRDIGAGNYIVKAGFGTPKREFNLIFDTGSDVTWLKCVSNGGYQPSASSTSTNATCNPGSNYGLLGAGQAGALSLISQTSSYRDFAQVSVIVFQDLIALLGITIGDQRIDISSKTIMDSGTVITRLPSTVYSTLCSTFMKFMSKYDRASSSKLLDTCYKLKGYGNVTVPIMAIYFAKIKVDLDPSARTLNVLFNIQDNKVEFGNGGCAN
ncbi:hypothetical protein ACOSP7_007993 [Xanthoceras sorbifolium]